MIRVDVIVIGAGGAGMMCAIEAGKRGRNVLLLDHSKKIGSKILISGGGRCNFTNLGAHPGAYLSNNPHFCKSAFSRYTPQDFVALVEKHGIAYHEKKLGQQFCDGSAQNIVNLLVSECESAGAQFSLETRVLKIRKLDSGFEIEAECREVQETYACESLVIATGGLSIPKIGATGFGYTVAKQFGLNLIETAPALDGFNFSETDRVRYADLTGVSADTVTSCNEQSFRENILFTHGGLSGPAILQASLYWRQGDSISINFLPEINLFDWLIQQKRQGSRAELKNLLSEVLARRLAERLLENHEGIRAEIQKGKPLPQISERVLESFSEWIHNWTITPASTVGYSKAEVTRGGVDTNELSSKTMECKKVPGLYFIGEVVDVTGRLGGYNFQWAWASGWAAGQEV